MALLLQATTPSFGAVTKLNLANTNQITGVLGPNNGGMGYIAGAGSVNVMTATFSPAVTSLVTGMCVWILPNLANTTTTPTLNVNGLGAKTVKKFGATALVAGDYSTTAIGIFCYDGTAYQLLNPVGVANTVNLGTPTTLTLTNATGLPVAGGGTGRAVTVAFAPIVGGTTTTGAMQSMAVGTAKQMMISGGSAAVPTYIDFPEHLVIPAANCVNGTAGAGWSLGASGVVTCRAGTNNIGGYIAITDTSSTFAQFYFQLPTDWDTASLPFIRFQFAYPGTDGSSSHTIITAVKVSCMVGNGSATDDVTFATSHSLNTVTLTSATANLFFNTSTIQLNSTDMSGCVGGSGVIVQVGRATDTATSAVNYYSATITIPRLVTVQAN